jgi:hypothetical protein
MRSSSVSGTEGDRIVNRQAVTREQAFICAESPHRHEKLEHGSSSGFRRIACLGRMEPLL